MAVNFCITRLFCFYENKYLLIDTISEMRTIGKNSFISLYDAFWPVITGQRIGVFFLQSRISTSKRHRII